MSRSDALKFLKTKIAHALVDDDDSQIESLTTGSLAIDIITGIGGFPRGRMSEVFGWEGAGKSMLCQMAFAAAQRANLYPVYVDIERGVDPTLATHLGCDFSDQTKGLYLQPNTMEETIQIIEEFAKSGECDLVIADSIPAMVPESIFEGKIEETGKIGELSRLLSAALPRITKTLSTTRTALVFTNQMRQTLGAQMGPWVSRETKEHTAGGSAPKFYSSLRIEMSLQKKGQEKRERVDLFTGKDIEEPIANLHTAKAFKNKVAAPYRTCAFTIRYDAPRNIWGIDNLQTMIDIGLSQGFITKKGSFYLYQGVNANGVQGLYTAILESDEVRARLQEDVFAVPEVKAALRR